LNPVLGFDGMTAAWDRGDFLCLSFFVFLGFGSYDALLFLFAPLVHFHGHVFGSCNSPLPFPTFWICLKDFEQEDWTAAIGKESV